MTGIDSTALAERLRSARSRLGWTQREAATRSSIAQATIARLELARNIREEVAVISTLADTYGVRLDHLLYGSPVAARVLAAARTGALVDAAAGVSAPAVALLEFDDSLDAVTDELRQSRRTPELDVPRSGSAAARGRELAARVRELLELGHAPIADMPALISELTGVDVGSADLASASGMCIIDPDRDTAIVLVNNTESLERQRFTYAHELGHLLFGDGAHIDGLADRPTSIETRANEFARALLVPSDALRGWLAGSLSVTTRIHVTERELALAARHFGVSPEAAAIAFDRIRMLPAGLTPASARTCASRYGWAGQYERESDLARQSVTPQRIVERATRAYHAGRLGVAALAALTGADVGSLEAGLVVASVAPTQVRARVNIDDLLARAAAKH